MPTEALPVYAAQQLEPGVHCVATERAGDRRNAFSEAAIATLLRYRPNALGGAR